MTDEQMAFWLRVDKKSPDECWPWLANCTKKGYGTFMRHGPHSQKRAIKAHKYSYLLHNGPIENGLWVLHKTSCNNPSCVNPNHLKLGTAKDNANDRDSQGRHYLQVDPSKHFHKLSPEEVKEIRWLQAHGLSRKATATQFNTSLVNIDKIVSYRTWRNI